jgi:hypothetical protein
MERGTDRDGRGFGVGVLAGLLIALVAAPTAARGRGPQDIDGTVGELLDAHRTTGVLETSLDGSAGELLAAELDGANAFLIGELHLTAEIPQLARVLVRAGAQHGYDRLAIEVGPVTARTLADAAASGVDAMAGLARRYPFGFPFYDRGADAALLVEAVASGYALLGLDQEFLGAPRILLDRLQQHAGDEAAREAVETWRTRELRALERFMQSQDMSGSIMTGGTAEEFAALRDHFRDPAARSVVDEMAESAAIYQEFRRGENYRSNHHRIAWMKAHLRGYAGAASSDSKLLVKFGSVHMGRGYSPLNQLDLGNHIAELAAAAGGRSFHLITMAGSIRQVDGSVSEIIGPGSYLRPLLDRAADEGWTVFDLRPLRPFFHRDAHRETAPELADLVFRYDALAMRQQMNEASRLP